MCAAKTFACTELELSLFVSIISIENACLYSYQAVPGVSFFILIGYREPIFCYISFFNGSKIPSSDNEPLAKEHRMKDYAGLFMLARLCA